MPNHVTISFTMYNTLYQVKYKKSTMSKILFIHYFATGEGQTIYIRSNLQDHGLTKNIPNFYLKSVEYFEIVRIISILNYENTPTNEELYFIETLKECVPMFYNLLSKGIPTNLNYEHHVNFS